MNKRKHFLKIIVLFMLTACGEELPTSAGYLNSAADMNEESFNTILDRMESIYGPLATRQGATLIVNRRWTNDTTNASATQYKNTWELNAYGGMALEEKVSRDGFTLIMCHEIGHHFGGFPFRPDWGGNEGQADYFSTQSCAREMWRDEGEENRGFREKVAPYAKDLCDKAWTQDNDRDLCYRSMTGSLTVATFLGHGQNVSFETRSRDRVAKTYKFYPTPQCRLDTLVAGALCTKKFNREIIPSTESEAAEQSCLEKSREDELDQRPRCWFAPTI